MTEAIDIPATDPRVYTATGWSLLEKRLALTENYLIEFHNLGLVTDADQVIDHTTKARQAETLAKLAPQTLRKHAKAAAAKLGAFDETQVIAAAAKLPSADAVTAIANELFAEHVNTAHGLVFERVGDLPGLLTAELGRLADQAIPLGEQLANIDGPATAIEQGVTDEYRQFAQLNTTIDSIRTLVGSLRYDRLLEGPRGDDGWHWSYLTEPDRPFGGPHMQEVHRRANRVAELRAGLWVPATREDAEKVRADA